jgi:hypothetical protein
MIVDSFNERTLAHMEAALDFACRGLVRGGDHAARRRIAGRILQCARNGDVTLEGLTRAGLAAARVGTSASETQVTLASPSAAKAR